MNDAVKTMLERYNCSSTGDYENALKEIIQEIALLGLWRAKFFEKAAFYGGSALRILYGLDRFSEDLHFTLLQKNLRFSIGNYCSAVENELKSFGFSVIVEKKVKKFNSNIDSAFIKAGTLKNMIIVDIPVLMRGKTPGEKLMKIRLEVDKDPPGEFSTEAKYILKPIPFYVNTITLPHLFAGKMHAILCRAWISRVKERDWYDLVWFVGRDVPVGLGHLENRMKQTGHLAATESLTKEILKQKLRERIGSTDFNNARKDVEIFVKDRSTLELWSKEFFVVICEKIKTIQ